jgi:hypothetical protein
VVFG